MSEVEDLMLILDRLAAGRVSGLVMPIREVASKAAALIRTQQQRIEEQSWRPIDSAPKDGTFVLTWSNHCGIGVAKWFQFPRTDPVGFDDAAYWMPLPPPPAISSPRSAE